ncbi:MAG TPA: SurA N-terminal domain-containing protein [Phycisphaerales bacterium]|nr:SurA N-terminal domain-containing protein [Phycisphaerales bacterium]
MFKFLRQYSKHLMAFFGCLLMVAFLLPGALQQFGKQRPGMTVATVDGRKVTAAQMQNSMQDLQYLSQFAGVLLNQLGIENPEHWFLLTHEAEHAGLVGGAQDGQTLRQIIAEETAQQNLRQLASMMAPDQYRDFFNRQVSQMLTAIDQAHAKALAETRMTPERAEAAMAKLQGVLRLQEAYASAGTLSTGEVLVAAHEALDTAIVDALTIPGSSVTGDNSTITEERMAAHFEKYKSVRKGEGEFGIGYLRPPAAKVDYIGIDGNSVKALVQIDPIEINKYWQQNKSQYPADFEAARPTVEERFRRNALEKLTARFVELVRRESQRSLTGVPDKNGFRELPADWATKRPALADVVQKIKADLGSDTQVPGVQLATPGGELLMQTREDLAAMPLMSTLTYRFGERQTIPYADLVMGVKEFTNGQALPGLQAGVFIGPLMSPTGSVYFIRVLETRGESPPDSLAEVRQQVIKDLQAIDGYQVLLSRQSEIENEVAGTWVGSVGMKYQAQPDSNLLVTRQRVTQEGAQVAVRPAVNNQEFRDLVMNRVGAWDPKTEVSTIDPAQKVVSLAVPKELSLVVAQVKGRRPPTIEQFRRSMGLVQNVAYRRLLEGIRLNEMTYQKLAARHQFTIVGAEERDQNKAKNLPAESPAAPIGP